MYTPIRFKRLFSYSLILLIGLSILSFAFAPTAQSSYRITATTNKPAYYLREELNVLGNFTDDSSPINDVLVSIEVRDPDNGFVAYRTIPIGNPTESWAIDIISTSIRDIDGNSISSAKINTLVRPSVTVYNTLGNHLNVFVAITIYDENLIPFYASGHKLTISRQSSVTTSWSTYIPEWACPGNATVYCNVYSDYPMNGGVPYAPEKSFDFYVTRNPDLEFSYSPPKNTYTTSPGKYSVLFKIPPDAYTLPGTYMAYVVGRISPGIPILTATTFDVESEPCPPQASFTYSPLKAYANMSITFDASSSSAEGYNDTIVSYEWYINDPYNPTHISPNPSPFTSYTFGYGGTYVVQLNVTDKEGLWSTTSKPINILPEFGPSACFTWSPPTPVINQTVAFNASCSELGWSAKLHSFSPIQNYVWNFSDGTGNITTGNPMINHEFSDPGNYTVALTVIDTVGRFDTTWHKVEVQNVTAKYCDVVSDGIINWKDIYAAILAFGSSPGDDNWNPRADVIKDGIINWKDIYQIILYFGQDP